MQDAGTAAVAAAAARQIIGHMEAGRRRMGRWPEAEAEAEDCRSTIACVCIVTKARTEVLQMARFRGGANGSGQSVQG